MRHLQIIDENRINVSKIKLPLDLSARFRKNSVKMSAYSSNRIEGNPLSYEEAERVIESKNRHYLKPEQEIRNYYEALMFLDSQLSIKRSFSLDLILETQKIIVTGESKEKIGIRGAMPPGVIFGVFDAKTGKAEYIPPEHTDIVPLLDELIEYVSKSDDHPVIKAAIVHYQIVTIHPFEDGNGRTARILSNYILEYYGYGFNNLGSLEEYFAYDTEEYYNSLQMGLPALYYQGRDNPPNPEIWINYFLRMVELYSSKVLKIADTSSEDSVLSAFSHLSSKEKSFLQFVLSEHYDEFTPIEIAKVCEVSNRTVVNWCVGLTQNGFLKPNLAKQRIRSYSLSDFALQNRETILSRYSNT